MATITLTLPRGANPPDTWGSLQGVNVTPMIYADWNLKALASSAAISDVIETPVIDMNAVAPNTNRLALQKLQTTAAADTMKLLVSADGTNWYTAPLYNGGTGGGIAVANPSVAELALVGLPTMRYVKGQLALAAAMSSQTASRLAISFMRF